MTGPIIYLDRSDVRPGALSGLRDALARLVAFVQAREPQLVTYGFHVDESDGSMTLVAVHPDSASLELHLRIGGPEFRKVGEFIVLREIEVFGEPDDAVMPLLHEKARMLGGARVAIWPLTVGFDHIGVQRPTAAPG